LLVPFQQQQQPAQHQQQQPQSLLGTLLAAVLPGLLWLGLVLSLLLLLLPWCALWGLLVWWVLLLLLPGSLVLDLPLLLQLLPCCVF
jgi:hypothetical protein